MEHILDGGWSAFANDMKVKREVHAIAKHHLTQKRSYSSRDFVACCGQTASPLSADPHQSLAQSAAQSPHFPILRTKGRAFG